MTQPTILLIPGLMNDGWVWAEQLPRLSRRAPVVIACNDDCDDLGRMAEQLLETTRGPLLIAGHSMGGRVALEMVARAPGRIARLALLSTGAHGVRSDEIEGRRKLVALAEAEGMAAVADAWLPAMMAAGAPAAMKQAVRAMLERATPASFAAQQEALLTRPDRSALLPTITIPTLIATGAEDDWASSAQHGRMAAGMPHARLEIVPGAGHMLPVEAGAALTTLLESFFSAR